MNPGRDQTQQEPDREAGARDSRWRTAITGRLASMPREEAKALIERRGGRYEESVDTLTDQLVVGFGGPPIGEDGRLTQKLRKARELQDQGNSLSIVSEEDWLRGLDETERCAGLRQLYTADQLTRVLNLSRSQLRLWIRHGLLLPVRSVGRMDFFDFRQVSELRSLIELTRSGIRPAQIRKSLAQLNDSQGLWGAQESAGLGCSLAQLEALELDGDLLVRLSDGRLAEPTGQLRLEFDGDESDSDSSSEAEDSVAAPASEDLPPERLTTSSRLRSLWTPQPEEIPSSELMQVGPRLLDGTDSGSGEVTVNPDDWFERGLEAEDEERFEAAVYAYERALEAEPNSAEIHFNLGNVYYRMGRSARALKCFTQASELESDYAEAWNNRANVKAEMGLLDGALADYRIALSIDPNYADAHYNCAEALSAAGKQEQAKQHWRAYLAQDPNCPWAEEIRQRLRE